MALTTEVQQLCTETKEFSAMVTKISVDKQKSGPPSTKYGDFLLIKSWRMVKLMRVLIEMGRHSIGAPTIK